MTLASSPARMYCFPVAANSVTWNWRSGNKRRTPPQSGFFVSAARQGLYGRAVWGCFGSTGFVWPVRQPARFAHPDWRQGSGKQTATNEATTMPKRYTLTLNPSKNRAAAYRARAMSALRSDSSLSVRLKRYNEAMTKARALEAQEVGHV